MADTKRRKPYVYVTWITKLLSGESACWYAAWYKSQHKYDKVPDDFPDREAWIKKHDAITNRREAELIEAGYLCKKEDAAEFTLQGQRADLAGKPDLVAMKGDAALVVDAKSGKAKLADHWQVLIYLFALPRTWLTNFKVAGEIERVEVNAREYVRALGEAETASIVHAMQTMGAPIAPIASPGPSECRYCDILSCTFRYKKPAGDVSSLW